MTFLWTGMFNEFVFMKQGFIIFLIILIALLIFVQDLLLPLGVAGGVPYVALALMGLFFENRGVSLLLGFIGSLLTVIGYFLSPDGGEFWVVILNRCYAIFAIWIVSLGVFKQKAVLNKLSTLASKLSVSNKMLEKKVKERTKSLELALEEQKEINEMKSRFVSVASHEFRTPLSVILSSTSLIERYNEEGKLDKSVKHVERIKSSVKALSNLLDNFLSLEKLDKGKLELNRENFNLKEYCAQILDEMNLIKKTDQKIIFTYDGNEDVRLLDKKIIRNVITNLVSNAIKYSPEASDIFFDVKANTEKVSINVRDNGIGIPEEEQEKLFKLFFRAKNTVNIEGTGLGLNIVKKHVELLGGSINFTSKSGEGTTFMVDLPQ